MEPPLQMMTSEVSLSVLISIETVKLISVSSMLSFLILIAANVAHVDMHVSAAVLCHAVGVVHVSAMEIISVLI